jgi:1-deoxy-D-xylulose-5-phosphate reductoisomerase
MNRCRLVKPEPVEIKNVAILGSTGSIGTQTLDVIRRIPSRLRVTALAAGSNAHLLAAQTQEFKPLAIALSKPGEANGLEESAPPSTELLYGSESLALIAVRPDVDIVVVAVDGAIGIRATIAALLAGKIVALATKEVLVAAGEIVMNAARMGGGALIPVDSEHSAVLQCIQGAIASSVDKIWLTASGGPFRTWTSQQISAATVDDALNHPTWQMGRKITVDSATMMNKGLETIEARWLFDIDIERVGVIVHPQSTVHAMVQFQDGSIIAQVGHADMRLPIEYALLFPERIDAGLPKLDVLQLSNLQFEQPDEDRFPCLRLAREAAKKGGTAPAVLNGANEAAVRKFLEGKLPFVGIAQAVEEALVYHTSIEEPTLEDILSADGWARDFVSEVAVP